MLAQNIVAQVKRRGPFKSMAEFINRNLSAQTYKGVLQEAIDSTMIHPDADDVMVSPMVVAPPIESMNDSLMRIASRLIDKMEGKMTTT